MSRSPTDSQPLLIALLKTVDALLAAKGRHNTQMAYERLEKARKDHLEALCPDKPSPG